MSRQNDFQSNNNQQKSVIKILCYFESVRIIGHKKNFLVKFDFFLPFIQKIQSHFGANLF
jgi:hypothetical protein